MTGIETRPCELCGDAYTPNASWRSRQKFCSNKCRWAARTARLDARTCVLCGDTFPPGGKRYKFCSNKCAAKGKDEYAVEYNARVAKRLMAEKSNLDRQCPHCGCHLSPIMNANAAYCSRKCVDAARSATRAARMRVLVDGVVERIPRAYIIERDNSRCHLCRKKCKPSEIHLDHVIPLSKGGTHTLENLRVAHAKCNIAKGARACNEQLMLVG